MASQDYNEGMLSETTLDKLRAGDRCVINDGNLSHASGQLVIVVDRSVNSEMNPPAGETRWPVLIPESGRLILQVPSTPVLVCS